MIKLHAFFTECSGGQNNKQGTLTSRVLYNSGNFWTWWEPVSFQEGLCPIT